MTPFEPPLHSSMIAQLNREDARRKRQKMVDDGVMVTARSLIPADETARRPDGQTTADQIPVTKRKRKRESRESNAAAPSVSNVSNVSNARESRPMTAAERQRKWRQDHPEEHAQRQRDRRARRQAAKRGQPL